MKTLVLLVALTAIAMYAFKPVPTYYCPTLFGHNSSVIVARGIYFEKEHSDCQVIGVTFFNPEEVW